MVSASKRLSDSKAAWVLSSVPADWLIDSLPQSLVSISGGDEPNTIRLLSVTVTECPRLLHHRRKGPVCLHCRIIGSPLALRLGLVTGRALWWVTRWQSGLPHSSQEAEGERGGDRVLVASPRVCSSDLLLLGPAS